MKTTNENSGKPKRFLKAAGRHLQLKDNKHSGKLLAHHQTSYGVIFLLLLLLIPQFIITRGVNGVVTSSGNVQVALTVPGPAPSIPATITSPAPGIVHTQNITVSGTCSPGLLVRIFRNNVFAGSTFCSDSGFFSLVISLYTGRNDLTALNYDALDQAGPVSPTVTVTYVPLTSPNQLTLSNLLLEVDYHLRQLDPNTIGSWQVKISFGNQPYRLAIDWGDNSKEEKIIADSSAFYAQHAFANPGKYQILFLVTDASGSTTRAQVAITVNGLAPVAATNNQKSTSAQCLASDNNGSPLGQLSCVAKRIVGAVGVGFFWLLLVVIGLLWYITELRQKEEAQRKAKPKFAN